MKISLFGIGYVGCVTSACLAEMGHEIICLDADQQKVDMINKGITPIYEEKLDDMFEMLYDDERLSATNDIEKAILETDLSIITVGTPSDADGNIDLSHLLDVTQKIARVLAKKNDDHTLVYRSTMFPGTIDSNILPLLSDVSGKQLNKDFFVYYYPEFLREGCAIEDFQNPERIILGGNQEPSGETMNGLFPVEQMPLVNFTTFKAAEMIKYVDNSWHALKVAYANEIGVLCHHFGIDSVEEMRLFKLDHKLNISENYLTPGFAFGGSCLPKELRAIQYISKEEELELPILNSILDSNAVHIRRVADVVKLLNVKSVGLIGITFKENSKDIRESPSLKLLSLLQTLPLKIRVVDELLYDDIMNNTADKMIYDMAPEIKGMMCPSILDMVEHVDVLVILHHTEKIRATIAQVGNDKKIIDLKLVCRDGKHPDEYITIV